jgi:hypothetical protein
VEIMMRSVMPCGITKSTGARRLRQQSHGHRRGHRRGDFNIDLDILDLVAGLNNVTLQAALPIEVK